MVLHLRLRTCQHSAKCGIPPRGSSDPPLEQSSTIRAIENDLARSFELEELRRFSSVVGLERVAAGRYSLLFAAQILWHMERHSINPAGIVAELRDLEAGTSSTGTKPASQYTLRPLKGLWHKHFFSGHFVARNIRDHLAGGRMRTLVEEVMTCGNAPVVTEEMIRELTRRAVCESIEARQSQGKLTGEWIVFAKYRNRNYYLSIATHNMGDIAIYAQLKSGSFPQFPFLQTTLESP